MNISHSEAYEIECIVLSIVKCNKNKLGGIVSADWFEKRPFDAAIICITKLYNNSLSNLQIEAINNFVNTWRTVFDYPEENSEYTINQYITELKKLTNTICYSF